MGPDLYTRPKAAGTVFRNGGHIEVYDCLHFFIFAGEATASPVFESQRP